MQNRLWKRLRICLTGILLAAGGSLAEGPSPAAQQAEPPAVRATLHCVVINPAGMGVAGATVEAATLGAAGWPLLSVEQTDRAGGCDISFGGAEPSLLQLKVTAGGYHSLETLYVPRVKDVVAWQSITLTGARSLQGRVLTETRDGVAEAVVGMDTPVGLIKTLSNQDGSFGFYDLLPVKVRLMVQVPGVGLGTYQVDLTVEQTIPIEILLYAQRQVTLRVVDAKGKSLPGLMVAVLAPQATSTTTDSDGTIAINGVAAGKGRVVVMLWDEFYSLGERPVSLPVVDGQAPVELEVTAAHGGLIETVVLEKQSSDPIPAAVVWFSDTGKVGANITCDSEGKATFTAVAPGEYLLVAGHATYGFDAKTISVEPGKRTEVRFGLAPGATLQGKIADGAGALLGRAIVRAATWVPEPLMKKVAAGQVQPIEIPWRAVRADADGHYELQYLPAGRITLEITDANGRKKMTQEVKIPENSNVLERDILFSPQ